MEGLGLARVRDTFVGDQETVRGVSGGEKVSLTFLSYFLLLLLYLNRACNI
jgi:hypothetical protein